MSVARAPSYEQRYRELFEGALLGIYVSRPDGALVACNAEFARMLGFASVTDAIGTRMSAVYDDARDRRARARRPGAPVPLGVLRRGRCDADPRRSPRRPGSEPGRVRAVRRVDR